MVPSLGHSSESDKGQSRATAPQSDVLVFCSDERPFSQSSAIQPQVVN